MAKSLSKTRVSNFTLENISFGIHFGLDIELNYFYRYSQTNNAPFLRPAVLQDYSSDGDTEDE